MLQSEGRNELLTGRSEDSYVSCFFIPTNKILLLLKGVASALSVSCLLKEIDVIGIFLLFHVVWVHYHSLSHEDWAGSHNILGALNLCVSSAVCCQGTLEQAKPVSEDSK